MKGLEKAAKNLKLPPGMAPQIPPPARAPAFPTVHMPEPVRLPNFIPPRFEPRNIPPPPQYGTGIMVPPRKRKRNKY